MSTTSVLVEELGPRGKRRVRIATVVALALAALAVYWIYLKLSEANQLEAARWTDLFDGPTLRFLGKGLLATIKAAIGAGIGAVAAGFGLALLRLSKNRLARAVALTWVEIFRGLPLLLLIFGVYFIDSSLASSRGGDATLGAFWSLVIALVLYNSAVFSEIFRAGVRSLDHGQTEAAQSVGMSYWQTMGIVVLPQAVRRMVPAIVAQLATLTKDVSLGFPIAYEEFVRRGSLTQGFPGTEVRNLQAYVAVGVVYFLLVWAMARTAQWLDERQKRTPKAAAAGGIDDLGLDDALGAAP
ncbi:MAG: amino acid ABC transporter permease [Candidatus Microthrix subdominans]